MRGRKPMLGVPQHVVELLQHVLGKPQQGFASPHPVPIRNYKAYPLPEDISAATPIFECVGLVFLASP